jgi:hypothetical protein
MQEQSDMTTQPSPSRFPWVAIILAIVMALAGIGLLTYALLSVRSENTPPVLTLAPTQVAIKPTAIIIPTITAPPAQAPTQAAATSVPPTEGGDKVIPATDTPAPSKATASPAEPILTIVQSANVRSGPGLAYPIIGGLQAATTVPALGRDAAGQWYVIQYGAGQGWVSGIVAQYTGDPNSLPVVAAPPPPVPTATPVPTAVIPANTPVPAGYWSRGISGDSFTISTSGGVGAEVWFTFQVTNTTDNDIPYGALSAHTDVGPTGKSWTNSVLKAHRVLKWTDHMQFPSAGTYQVYAGICYDDGDTCYSGSRSWDRLSGSITVTIQ